MWVVIELVGFVNHILHFVEFLLCLNVLMSYSRKRLTLINVAHVPLSCSESSLFKESFVKSVSEWSHKKAFKKLTTSSTIFFSSAYYD